ncbi:acyl-CoA synthetase, putative [Entamoeba histolytica HM-1:IMSS-B]|uniref:Acyl-CoA synthetase, putative n=5 Tax=Entamoeba histolytica TaxID=5759 RepID=C4M964_ENTH1|nr:acyl-CoA synthetase, putative [Entamoeba histolytica HM-1:IMSS]EMD48027.1 4-coumarate-CoA ligase, putative [Entamoeba histolytica KU27]EMH75997.1 acyl-CoA synthetase, putative [Entamoeba histolytica HM-1:IMSS-B]ENY61474.1 4-coumarate--CoA ligase, putative [Entamoeba histolytica HM-1:IMSS-A]GAT98184.1 acyl-coa synthetase putative [Entamoeba histolytica]EAL48611.1 acyl-CoA synthetase, putative [Entamoeba histolytica HM-1:IMSS]|eukprot:XP_653997.1 acyl-CoA synthetase, putative [Entamoeba histolytica HM-1:IMSS]
MSAVHLTQSYIKSSQNTEIQFNVFAQKYQHIRSLGDKPLFKFIKADGNEPAVEYNLFQFQDKVDIISSALYTTLHLKRKDVIAIYLPNCVPFIIMEAVIESSGFIMMPFNPTYTSDQLSRLFPRVTPKLVVTIKRFLPNIRSFNKEVKALLVDASQEEIISMNDSYLYSLSSLLQVPINKELLQNERNQIQPEDELFYGCTSGSTGIPKICVYTNREFTGNIVSISSQVPPDERKTLAFIPFFTTTGHIVLSTLILKGYYHVCMDKFNTEKVYEIVQENKITNISGAPSAFMAILKHPNRSHYDLSSLREVIMGGAVASDSFIESCRQTLHLEFCCSGFGMTELCGLMYKMPSKATHIPAGPVAHYEVRVVDHETREILPIGLAGELEVRSPIMMKEYLNNPEANKQAFTEDRWFRTGDEAVLEEDGFMRITGRVKEMIIRGGHNIWPAEINDTLIKHPKIQEAAVIGIPDKIQGETVVAFVVIKKGCSFDNLEKDLKEFLKEKLVPFSIPTYIFAIEDMPRTSFGKVYAPKLKEIVKDCIKKRWEALIQENHNPVITQEGKEIAQLWADMFDIPINALSRDSNFYNCGGDSFVGSQTVTIIRKYVKDAPFNLLICKQTLGEIEDYIAHPNENVIDTGKILKEDIEKLNQMSEEELFGTEQYNEENENRDAIVITGACGYLGVYIVDAVAKNKNIKKIYCIGRSVDLSELNKKMISMMRNVGLQKNEMIEMIVGDVSKDHFGIENTKYNEMRERSKVIIHCAAIVNWNKSYSQLKETNVNGVINAIKFAGKSIICSYISTIGAALNQNETISEQLPVSSFGYIQSKWMGEKIIEKAMNLGYRVNIMRPAFIVADSTKGICNTDDFIYKFIRVCVMNNIGLSGPALDLTPVDKVAEVIAKNCMVVGKIINLLPQQQVHTEKIFSIYNTLYHSIPIFNYNEWINKFTELAHSGCVDAINLIPSLYVLKIQAKLQSNYLKETNQQIVLNFNDDMISLNLNKLNEIGFFTTSCKGLISRSK